MLHSMTGYGSASFKIDELELEIEIKTLNSKYLDTKIILPSSISVYELELNKLLKDNLIRGKVDLRIKFSDIASESVKFESREEVRNLLPDILGKVLARVWLDSSFHHDFSRDPQKTLEKNGVFLPENMSIEFQKQNTDRPRIVVFEQKPGSKFKLRVFYLQLVMMAGR